MSDAVTSPAPSTLLCVDDEANILAALRRLLRPAGYRILTATSGAEGLRLLDTESVDLIISDMRMPEMDGADFLARARRRRPDVVRLLLTGYADVASILDAINRGEIYRYITKPWDDNDLLLTVAGALERATLLRNNAHLEKLTRLQNEALRELNHDLEAKVAHRTAELAQSHDALLAANGKLKAGFVTTIKVFSSMIEMRGGILAGHAPRVADFARKIAVRMGLASNTIQDVFIAALLKDIGKIGFKDGMLGMSLGAMSGEQLALFRKHPGRAGHLLMALDDLRGAAAILGAQLERYDGAGFPEGLSGAAIPIGARILAVAADYDALQSGAMLQRQLHLSEAAQLISESSGRRYDPDVVAAFRHILDGSDEPNDIAVLSGELAPGMVLSRDLYSREGLMLLSAEHVLSAVLIQQVLDFENKSAGRLTIRVHQAKTA